MLTLNLYFDVIIYISLKSKLYFLVNASVCAHKSLETHFIYLLLILLSFGLLIKRICFLLSLCTFCKTNVSK